MGAFGAKYPTLCDLLSGTVFDADAKAADDLAKSKDDMKTALQGRVFALNELMRLLCSALFPEWAKSEAAQLEEDLAAVVGTVGIAAARTAYKDKLLVEAKSTIQDPKDKNQDAKNKLEDVRYEFAVTARACTVLDPGSIQLEKPIPDPNKDKEYWKNSDVFGTFQSQPVRIEVTVLHEAEPAAIHIGLDDLVRQAGIASGFQISLRSVLLDKSYAERVRALVELLHEHHAVSAGEDREIDGVHFNWNKGAYHCPQETSPFTSICFYTADEFAGAEQKRDIIHPSSERHVTSKHVLEDQPNPPGVVTFADLPDAPTQVPVSTKVRQMLDGKRQQCEMGIINIVAFGNPQQMHDREVLNALCGSEAGVVPFWTDKHGVRHSGKGVLLHDPKAPFVPEQYLANSDDRTQFIEPFRKLSAVWHIRLGWYAKSTVIPNPNALIPIPRELVEAISDPSPPPAEATSKQPDDSTSSPDQSHSRDQEEDIVWVEVAENYVHACGTIAEAQSVLADLEQLGQPLIELRRKVDEFWSPFTNQDRRTEFVPPTNEVLAMTFVIDCGGYEQAKVCLEEYVKETTEDA